MIRAGDIMAQKRSFWDVAMQIPSNINDLVSNQIRDEYEASGRKCIYEESLRRKITPFVAHMLLMLKIDEEYWRKVHDEYEDRNKKVIEVLNLIFEAFEQNECFSPCVTENFGALLASNSCIGCFCSGDVDLSADYSEAAKIRETIEKLGFKAEVRKKYHTVIKQDEYKCPDELLKDFYINIVWLPVIREKAYTIDQTRMIAWMENQREQLVSYKNTSIKLLSKEATLIHSIYHLSVGHYYCASPGIRLLTEVDRIVRNCDLDWNYLFENAKNINIEKRVLAALYLSMVTLDTPLPPEIEKRCADNKAVQKLVKMMVVEENGIMYIHEPLRLIERLYVDIVSDPGSLLDATIRKTCFAAKYLVLERE